MSRIQPCAAYDSSFASTEFDYEGTFHRLRSHEGHVTSRPTPRIDDFPALYLAAPSVEAEADAAEEEPAVEPAEEIVAAAEPTADEEKVPERGVPAVEVVAGDAAKPTVDEDEATEPVVAPTVQTEEDTVEERPAVAIVGEDVADADAGE